MTRREFDELAEKYKVGKCTPDEAALIEEWAGLYFKRHSEQSVFESSEEMSRAEERIWAGVRTDTGLAGNRKALWARGRFWAGLAASVVLLIAATVSFYFGHDDAGAASQRMTGIETKNTTGTAQRVVLPDSSVVLLQSGAAVIAGEDYGLQTRSVYLTGEAFFDVQPDPDRPFLVYSGELVTEVLGTSFWVRPVEERHKIEVSVVTGKVSVFTGKPGKDRKRNGVIATPNQKVVYDTELKTIRQDLVDLPEIVVPSAVGAAFLFDDVPVSKVFELMRNAYGVEIMLGTPLLRTCVFTGDLSGLKLYEQLDFVCDVIGAEYDIRGTTIFVNGAGCDPAN